MIASLLKWICPALSLRMNWADRYPCSVQSQAPQEASPERVSDFSAGLATSAVTSLGAAGALSPLVGLSVRTTLAAPKSSLHEYETTTLLEVITAPLLASLDVDVSASGSVEVKERTGASLCHIATGGFNPTVAGTVAASQLTALAGLVAHRTPDVVQQIIAQAPTAWPFMFAACSRPVEHRWATRKMLDVGLLVLHPLIAQCKHHLDVARPFTHGMTTVLQTPGHRSSPSGHAAVAHLLAGLLGSFHALQSERDRLWKAAAAISRHREVAGLHFESDSLAGQALGVSVATWLLALASGSNASAATFNMNSGVPPAFTSLVPGSSGTAEWRWLYSQARAEW